MTETLKDSLEQIVNATVADATAVVELAETVNYTVGSGYVADELNEILREMVEVAHYTTLQHLKKLIKAKEGK